MSKYIVFENDLTPDGYCIGGEELEVKYTPWNTIEAVMYRGIDVLPIISQFGGMKEFKKALKEAKNFDEYINN